MPANKELDLPTEEVRRNIAAELLRLCEAAYALETARKAEIEKKSQFYLALITGLLGLFTISDKFTSIEGRLREMVVGEGRVLLTIELAALASFMVAALFCLLFVMMPRPYEQPYPHSLLTYLYQAESKFRTETDLLRAKAEEFAWASELSASSNVKKARWLLRLAICVLLNLVALALILGTLAL